MKKTALALLLAVAAIGMAYWWKTARTFTARQLIESLPQARATHVFIDVDGLRRAGLLDLIAGSKSVEDPDYKAFVAQTGLDYRTDLDAVAAAFSEGNTYLTLRGHFTWNKLAAYAQSHSGKKRAAQSKRRTAQKRSPGTWGARRIARPSLWGIPIGS